MQSAKQNFNVQKRLTAAIAVLFIIKIVAWSFTHSIAILTDAIEYTINVISSIVGLYSLYLSSLPRDSNHPYGHGKVEFISAAIEGTLMIVASIFIIYEAVSKITGAHTLHQLDWGIVLVAVTALVNYLLGAYAVKYGKKSNSIALIATGKHMQSDTYATIGIIVGLVVLFFTNYAWIDSVVAIVFAFIIIVSGYKIIRQSLAGIMDEADNDLLEKIVVLLNKKRKQNWIDLHNLRVIKYGSVLHLDCHLTVPWYFNVHEAHQEIDDLDLLIKDNFGESVELFVHTDGCLEFSCAICTKNDCAVRKHNFIKKIEWDTQNISTNTKHKA